MRPFSTSVLEVVGGAPEAFTPVPFDGHVSEAQLESWIVANPELVGERLLVLGQQLAEFEEDQDRLDVLAIDQDGEVVLIELKVSENFRVTDLQALAYAGAYASRDPSDLAQTLRQTLQKSVGQTNAEQQPVVVPASGAVLATSPVNSTKPSSSADATISLDESKDRIVEFLELDGFDAWQPSQHVRIKLVAPTFPRRVLKTVKWLGDVYDVPIEAITVRLFSQGDGRYSLTFERILPLPDEGEFDMTVRKREERKRGENATRRPALVPILVKEGLLGDGQKLWVSKTVLRPADRSKYNPDDPAYQVEVRVEGESPPKFAWRPSETEPIELLTPSAVPYRVWKAVTDYDGESFYSPVATNFTVEPEGRTLEQLAAEKEVWSSPET